MFKLDCGVRQGGVLSLVLFSIYINDVIINLQYSSRGCYIGQVFFGCILYAVNILLISPSCTGMQDMLEVCEAEIKWLDISFNIDKSMVMRIGLRYDSVCAELKIGDNNLKYVNTIKYLGIFLKANKIFSQDTHVLRSKFFRSLNGIYSQCSSKMSEIVLIELVRSYCLPFSTYCSESFSNDKETIAELSSCWHKAFRKIFRLPPWSSVNQILLFTSVLPLEYVIDQRRLNFMTNIQSLLNERVVMISQICRKKIIEICI